MLGLPEATHLSSSSASRVLIDRDPYLKKGSDERVASWNKMGHWPCKWIDGEAGRAAPFVTAYRVVFEVKEFLASRIHVTADERYVLYLDGKRIGRGSERGEPNHWFFETYDLKLSPGGHIITALVWSQGKERAFAQMSVSPGFLLSPQDEACQLLMGTGAAPWEMKQMEGYSYTDPLAAWGTGHNINVDGAKFDWNFLQAGGDGWKPARAVSAGISADVYSELLEDQHLLLPALLPAMMEEERLIGRVRHVIKLDPFNLPVETAKIPILAAEHRADNASAWQALFTSGQALTISANSTWRVIVDLEDYYCAYPKLVVSKGTNAMVRIHWQEALLKDINSRDKGHRDQIEGKYFVTLWWQRDGLGDSFKHEGGQHRVYEPLWWQAGRYVEVVVSTGEEELVIERLSFLETRYPMENESSILTSREDLNALVPILERSLHVCSHETYIDCPYFEQLCYVGDSRLDSLITFVTTNDSRLPRKTLKLFDWSRVQSGLTQSRFPSRVRQIIPPFSLWWICMVYDYARWRGDPSFIRSLMPGVRAVLEAFRSTQNEAGIITGLPGWNFVDWVISWDGGESSEGEFVANGTINWQIILASQYAMQLEEWLGEPDLARRQREWSNRLVKAVHKKYWNEKRGLFAENYAQTVFSTHAQALALISGSVSKERSELLANALLQDRSLVQPTLYFSHYLFEALQAQGQAGKIPSLLGVWQDLPKLGFKTTYESYPSTTRSDCHAWGAHPLYHYFATLSGIRPANFGFDEIAVTPALEELGWIKGEMPHPRGWIKFEFEQDADTLSGTLTLPEHTAATVYFAGEQIRLTTSSSFRLERAHSSESELVPLKTLAST